MIDAAHLAGQKIVTDEVLQIWECQRYENRKQDGTVVIRYIGSVGPQCRGCGGHKRYNVALEGEFTVDDVLARITTQVENGGA